MLLFIRIVAYLNLTDIVRGCVLFLLGVYSVHFPAVNMSTSPKLKRKRKSDQVLSGKHGGDTWHHTECSGEDEQGVDIQWIASHLNPNTIIWSSRPDVRNTFLSFLHCAVLFWDSTVSVSLSCDILEKVTSFHSLFLLK